MAYTSLADVPRGASLAVAGAVLLVVAAFLPWAVEGTATFDGFHESVRDGYLTSGLAVAVVAATVALEWNRAARAVAAVGGLLALLVFYNLYSPVGDAASAEPGLGLYLTLLGGGLLLVGAGYERYLDSSNDETPAADVEDEADGDDATS